MSTLATTLHEYRSQVHNNRLGLWLFFLSDAFLFGELMTSRIYLWGAFRPNLSQTLGLTITSVLLLSSFFMNRADMAVKHGDRKSFLENLLVTAGLGMVFLIGVVPFEWQGEVRPWDGAFGAVLFGMTGTHAMHVVSGIVLILFVWNKGRKGGYTVEQHWGAEACAIYWHFVDLVWVFYYPALYLIGMPPH